MKMKFLKTPGPCFVLIFILSALLTAHIAKAADWEEEDEAARTIKPPVRVRHYPGSGDEDELKVQAALPAPGRYPDSPVRAVQKETNPDVPDTPND
jgi:hypothetical protein